MSKLKLSILTAVVAALSIASSQQHSPPPLPFPAATTPRYAMAVANNGVYRIDTHTGRMWELTPCPAGKLNFKIMYPLEEQGGAADNAYHAWLRANAVPAK